MMPAAQALTRLREGNRRFVANEPTISTTADHLRRAAVVAGQEPIAIVLGCSDSRVPAEIVFDQGIGDLFVIRVAGNIVASSQIGSVEFAASRFGTRLVVVLGHTQCGAVTATLELLSGRSTPESHNLHAIVDSVRPAVEPILFTRPGAEFAELMAHAVKANVRASVDRLKHGSALLEQLIREQGLLVVGAEYSLESGEVNFLDGVAEPA